MKILSIETSCDETGITIIEAKGGVKNASFKILGDSLASQIKIHAPYGGVYPALAKREHIKNLPILLKRTLKKAGLDKKKKPFDLIAVTYGPGLEPALWTGIVFAQELAKKCLPAGRQGKVPIMPVNHMEGHILSVFGKNKASPIGLRPRGEFKIPKVDFPILSLLVSGGHTELVLAKDWMKYEVIGETVDDAAGEAFDKVARMLGLPYPGGPEISKLAEQGRTLSLRSLVSATARARGIFQQKNIRADKTKNFSFTLPRPMMYAKNFNFSFSGLKTAVLYLIRDKHPDVLTNDGIKKVIALEFENAVVETLVHKTKKAIEKYEIKTLIVAGGVASNKHLRKEIKKSFGTKQKILFPEKKLSTDNAVMIGIVGYLQFMKNKGKVPNPSKIKAVGNLKLK